MNAFHPATIEALHYEIAIHERFRAAAAEVADMYDTSEQTNRHTAVIADLTELIKLIGQADRDAAEDDRIAIELAEDDAETPNPFEIAKRTRAAFGLTGSNAEEVSVIRVELVPLAALDEDQPATSARGHGQDVVHACPPIGEGRAPRCGASGRTALFKSDVTCPPCRSLMAEQARAAGEPGFFGDADEDFEFHPTSAEDYAATRAGSFEPDADAGTYTTARLDGQACVVCAGEFAPGQPSIPTGWGPFGQLFAHPDCLEAEQAGFDAALAAATEASAKRLRQEAAQACGGSCGNTVPCAFGPHDPITTPSTPSTTGATDEP